MYRIFIEYSLTNLVVVLRGNLHMHTSLYYYMHPRTLMSDEIWLRTIFKASTKSKTYGIPPKLIRRSAKKNPCVVRGLFKSITSIVYFGIHGRGFQFEACGCFDVEVFAVPWIKICIVRSPIDLQVLYFQWIKTYHIDNCKITEGFKYFGY